MSSPEEKPVLCIAQILDNAKKLCSINSGRWHQGPGSSVFLGPSVLVILLCFAVRVGAFEIDITVLKRSG